MRKFWVVLIVLAVLVGGGLLTAGLLLRSFAQDTGPTEGVLYWTVDDAYPEERNDAPFAALMDGWSPVLHETTSALRRAARDDGISGLFMEIVSAPMSWAQIEELNEALDVFRASGKPAVAWVSFAGTREYMLALGAGRVAVAPEGNLAVLGAGAEMTFLAGTLDKLGMEADYVHVGRYKSAPESLTRTGPTEPHREMITALVDDHYRRLVDAVVDRRRLSRDAVVDLIDRGLFDAAGASGGGLVDEIAYVEDLLDDTFGDEPLVDLDDYVYARGGGGRARAVVALVHVTGTIVEGESSRGGFLQGPAAGSRTVIADLREAAEDPTVDAIVLRVDSPGGSATASDLIWEEALAAQAAKPLVVSMGGTAASGGYYVASPADSIFASPGTITGSIGVFAGKMDRHALYEKVGYAREFVTRGENALFFSDAARFTDAQRALLQTHLDSFYERFVGLVADGREMDPADVHRAAEGRVWTGAQALDMGLVDGLGGLHRALDSVRSLLDLEPGARLALRTDERRPGLLERLLARSLEQAGVTAPAPPAVWIAPGVGDLALQASLLDGRPLALMPLSVQFR